MKIYGLDVHGNNVTCSQWGCHPHEMHEEHPSDGGVGEVSLDQYRPPEIRWFTMCMRCAREIFGPDSFYRHLKYDEDWNVIGQLEWDQRFRWITEPR